MSTKMSTDLNISRPTSRVLRPPGGGSSNIFGTDEPVAAPARTNPSQAQVNQPPSKPVSLPAQPVVQQAAPQPNTGRGRRPPGGESSIVFG